MARGARHQQPAAGLGGHGRAGGRGQPLSPRRWVPGFPQSRDCSHQRMGRGSVAGLPAGPTARLSRLVAQLLVPPPPPPPSRASTPVTRCCSADHLEDRIAPVFADLDRPDSAGCAYAVVQDGELIATGGYGSAQLEHGVAIDPAETIFHVASVSKQFTAFAVTVLEHVRHPLRQHRCTVRPACVPACQPAVMGMVMGPFAGATGCTLVGRPDRPAPPVCRPRARSAGADSACTWTLGVLVPVQCVCDVCEMVSRLVQVTIRQMIYHTSGLRDQWELLNLAGWRMDDVITTSDILGLMGRQRELNFTPVSTPPMDLSMHNSMRMPGASCPAHAASSGEPGRS